MGGEREGWIGRLREVGLAFGALVWISVLGLVLYGAVAALSRVLAPWAEGQER